MVPDGFGGAIVAADVYMDDNSPNDIYAQRVDHDGNLLWGPRAAVCLAPNYQYAPVLAPDGSGGAIVAWEDYRESGMATRDIYCQRIGASGLWGNPEPEIVSCLDVPADQGGWVRIKTRASSLDVAGETDSPIFGYNVWRMIAGGGGPLAASAGAAKVPAIDRSKLLALLADPATAKGVRVGASQAAAPRSPRGGLGIGRLLVRDAGHGVQHRRSDEERLDRGGTFRSRPSSSRRTRRRPASSSPRSPIRATRSTTSRRA